MHYAEMYGGNYRATHLCRVASELNTSGLLLVGELGEDFLKLFVGFGEFVFADCEQLQRA